MVVGQNLFLNDGIFLPLLFAACCSICFLPSFHVIVRNFFPDFRYFAHALTLRDTVLFLRQNPAFRSSVGEEGEDKVAFDMCLGLDLIRCESLQSLDPSTASRLLNKNYS